MKKKILFVIPALVSGGAETVVRTILSNLDRACYEAKIITFVQTDQDEESLREGVELLCLKKKKRFDFFRLIWQLRNILKKDKPDILISFLSYANVITLLALLLGGKGRTKVIVSVRNNPLFLHSYKKFAALESFLMKKLYPLADVVTTNSNHVREVMASHFGVPARKLITIHNPVDIEAVVKKSQAIVSHRFFNEGKQVILSAGRLTPQKRFDRLLGIFAKVHARNPETRLIVLGEGEKRVDLENQAKALGLSAVVNFPGFQKNPYAWISKADVFVLCSDYEGFPNVVLESMVCKTPVVAGGCPYGPDEIITPGKDGFLVPHKDEQAYADSILQVLNQTDAGQLLTECAFARVQSFAIDKILPQYRELFSGYNK